MEHVLMREEREVLAFDVDLSSGAVRDVRPLEDASLAPPGVFGCPERPELGLARFVRSRRLSVHRTDLPDILRATGTSSPVELAFMSGGFSLSDPYWYRAPGSTLTWERGNFFDNDWDPSFGEAILRRDYGALGKASPVTPDVTCPGEYRKAWLRDSEGPRLLKAATGEGSASVMGEVLASNMLARLLPRDEFVSYELVERDGEQFSACRPMLGPGEELVLARQTLAEAGLVPEEGKPNIGLTNDGLLREFGSVLSRLGVEGHDLVIPKMMVFLHLVSNGDVHPYNLGTIRTGSGALRLAPFFDFDRAFGLWQPERIAWACAHPQSAMLMATCRFRGLDPSWDYSWYDRRALDGFEDEIVRTLRACDVVPEAFGELTADLFASQRAYVDSIACAGAAR